MTDSPLQLAKREWHTLIASPTTWIALVAAGIVLGFIGPFGTDVVMLFLPRVLYWTCVAVICYLTGALISSTLIALIRRAGLPLVLAAVLAGLTSGIVIISEIALINWLVFGVAPTDLPYLAELARDVLVISVVVTGAALLIGRQTEEVVQAIPPRILLRLPHDKRGGLLCLSVQDHYVEVSTTKGQELILMRLSDAISETGDIPGIQVHRSHWVANSAVTASRRDGAREILTLSNGQEIPVSRANMAAAKEAGLLPG